MIKEKSIEVVFNELIENKPYVEALKFHSKKQKEDFKKQFTGSTMTIWLPDNCQKVIDRFVEYYSITEEDLFKDILKPVAELLFICFLIIYQNTDIPRAAYTLSRYVSMFVSSFATDE